MSSVTVRRLEPCGLHVIGLAAAPRCSMRCVDGSGWLFQSVMGDGDG